MPGLKIELEGMDGLRAAFSRLIEQSSDLSKPMAEVAAVLLEGTQDRFANEVSPLGVPWAKSKRALKKGGLTLQDSGDLLHSIASNSGKDFAEVGVLRNAGLGHDKASVRDYAAIHQFGGTIKHPGGTAYYAPKGKRAKFIENVKAAVTHPRTGPHDIVMPARPYLGLGEFEKVEIEDVLERHIGTVLSAKSHG